jgi:H+-translocating NAD(P) transhydrogenase subunit alpha
MKNLRRINEGAVGNTKHQTPNTKKASSAKLQNGWRANRGLELGIWKFFGAWCLAFGVLAQASASGADAAIPANPAKPAFDLVTALFVFMLATFVGMDVIRRVSRLLHTPLMSLTNAISAIAVVGAILVAGPEHPTFIHVLGLIAVVASVTNIVSGFLITDRMLKMFKKKTDTNPQ